MGRLKTVFGKDILETLDAELFIERGLYNACNGFEEHLTPTAPAMCHMLLPKMTDKQRSQIAELLWTRKKLNPASSLYPCDFEFLDRLFSLLPDGKVQVMMRFRLTPSCVGHEGVLDNSRASFMFLSTHSTFGVGKGLVAASYRGLRECRPYNTSDTHMSMIETFSNIQSALRYRGKDLRGHVMRFGKPSKNTTVSRAFKKVLKRCPRYPVFLRILNSPRLPKRNPKLLPHEETADWSWATRFDEWRKSIRLDKEHEWDYNCVVK